MNYSFGDAWSVESPNITQFGVFGIDEIFSVQDYQNLYKMMKRKFLTSQAKCGLL